MKKKYLPLWIYTFSTFIGLLTIRKLFEKSSFILTNFTDRTIGVAVLQGIDIAARSYFYFKLIFIFSFIFLLCYYLFRKVWNIAETKIGSKNLKNDNNILLTLSISAIFTLTYHYINGAEIFAGILNILKLLITISFSVLICKTLFKKRDNTLFELFNNYNFVILSFLLPPVIFFSRWIIISGSFIFTKIFFIFYLVIWASYWMVLRIYFKFVTKKLFKIKIVSVSSASIPLLLIPFSTPILNELQYSFSSIFNWSIKRFEIIGLIILIIVSLFIFLFNKSKNVGFKFAKYVYLPIFVGTIALFNTHLNFLDISYLDMFHHGENLISTQQLFMFGKIPFIDLYPTHGISYMIGQVLYSLVNGYQPFAPWLWEWVTKILELILFYFVFAEITNSFFSAISIVFLPIVGVFGGQALIYGYGKSLPTTYYFAPLAIALVLLWSLKKPDPKRMFFLWLACIFLTAWRVDFGIAGFVSAVFIVLVSIISSTPRSIMPRLKIAVSTLVASFLVVVIPVVFLFTIKGESFLTTSSLILEFIKFQGQAQGLLPIIGSFSPISVFQYFILPSIAIFYVLSYLFNTLIVRGKIKIPNYKLVLVYLAIFSLTISIRSFQRQTLAILGYNPYLFAFLLLCLPVFLSKGKGPKSLVLFIACLMIYQFVLPNGAVLVKQDQQVSLYNWHNKEMRVHADDYQFKMLVDFLNSNLDKNQTFLDLSSSPLLYVASNRKFINYLIPSAYYTSEVIQKNELDKVVTAYNTNEIPIVIFRQPYLDANNIDSVPNEIRSYRIYEFINSHYRPIGYVMGYFIWVSNNSQLKNTSGLIPETTVVQQFNLQKLPFIWASYDSFDAKNNSQILQTFIDKSVRVSQGKNVIIPITKGYDKTSGNYLHFKIQTDNPGTFSVTYGPSDASQIKFDLVKSDKPEDYLIRISSQYYWVKNNIDSIKLSSSVDGYLTAGYLRKGD